MDERNTYKYWITGIIKTDHKINDKLHFYTFSNVVIILIDHMNNIYLKDITLEHILNRKKETASTMLIKSLFLYIVLHHLIFLRGIWVYGLIWVLISE